MKTRIFLLVLAVGAVLLLNSLIDVGAHPTIAADIAVSQLQNDEGAAVTMRSYDIAYNALPLLSWGAVTLFGLFLFRSPVKRGFLAWKQSLEL